MNKFPIKYLRECFDADFSAGKLFWRERPVSHFPAGQISSKSKAARWNARYAGTEAGMKRAFYRVVRLDGRQLMAHRAIWALHTGEWPSGIIDHINRDGHDNRIDNLRIVDAKGNSQNRSVSAGKDLPVGVSYVPEKWCAYIKIDGKLNNLGHYDNPDEAIAARKAAEVRFGWLTTEGGQS